MYQVQHKRVKFVGLVFLTVFSTYLNIPVLVEIVDARDESSIAVRVIDMSHVPCPVAWVTSNHSLPKKQGMRPLVVQKLTWWYMLWFYAFLKEWH